MKSFLKILILLAMLGALFYQFRATIFPPAPCSEPIPYTLGTFDTKFNISQKYFLSALSDAEAIWENPKGKNFDKNLFIYEPTNFSSSVLKINLIYDYRQEATSKLASLGIVVKNNKASYDELKAKFTALKSEYNLQKSSFSAQVALFNNKELAYQAEVKIWNAKGGAPEPEYKKIEAERLALDAELKTLRETQIHINNMTDEINALVVVLNRLVGTLNLSVNQYNMVNGARGESFEEGVYSSDGSFRQIDIYEFSNREKLVRVLAHELGHALGLDHVDDPKAIMYKLNQGNSQALTDTDLTALKTKCGIK